MDVFKLRNGLVAEYERFSRSFTRIRAADIRSSVGTEYKNGRFWPSPLIQLNPSFLSDLTVDDLVASGELHPECSPIFRRGKDKTAAGELLHLYRHQVEGIRAARRGRNYVLTTGTGSGKSLAYFIPIVDDVLRRRQAVLQVAATLGFIPGAGLGKDLSRLIDPQRAGSAGSSLSEVQPSTADGGPAGEGGCNWHADVVHLRCFPLLFEPELRRRVRRTRAK